MTSVHGEVSAPQEGLNAIVPFPSIAQPDIDFGRADTPVSQTVTISPASLEPLETFIFVACAIDDV